MGRLFDSPLHLLILLVVVLLLFGYKRLPDASRGLARSMRIFKSEIKQMQDDDKPSSTAPRPPTPTEPLEGRVVDGKTSETYPADHRRDV